MMGENIYIKNFFFLDPIYDANVDKNKYLILSLYLLTSNYIYSFIEFIFSIKSYHYDSTSCSYNWILKYFQPSLII